MRRRTVALGLTIVLVGSLGAVLATPAPASAVPATITTSTAVETAEPWSCISDDEDARVLVARPTDEEEADEVTADPVAFENLSAHDQELLGAAIRLGCPVKQRTYELGDEYPRLVIQNGTYYTISVAWLHRDTTTITSNQPRTTTPSESVTPAGTGMTTGLPSTTANPTTTTSARSTPGFGPIVAFVAIVLAGMVMITRR